MLVDDDPATSAMLQTLLQLEGFDTITCQDFSDEDVIRTLKHHKPDVLLIDVHLRNATGSNPAQGSLRTRNWHGSLYSCFGHGIEPGKRSDGGQWFPAET